VDILYVPIQYVVGDTNNEGRRWEAMELLITGVLIWSAILTVCHKVLIALDTDGK
jgi:hypothetical protein